MLHNRKNLLFFRHLVARAESRLSRRPVPAGAGLLRSVRILGLAAVLVSLLVPPLPGVLGQAPEPIPAPLSDPSPVRVLRSDLDGVLLELNAPPPRLAAGEGELSGYGTVRVAGFDLAGVPGAPQLPVKGFPVGVPAGAEVELRLIEVAQEALPGAHRLAPAPTHGVEAPPPDQWRSQVETNTMPRTVTFAENPAIYGADAYYPETPVWLVEVGQIRSQWVALVEYHPVLANAARGELTYTSRVVVELTFRHPQGRARLAGGDVAPEAGSFERLLQESLVNYDSAREWRAPKAPLAGAALATPAATPDPGYKVIVRETGLYELTYADLEAAGLPVGRVGDGRLEPATLQIYYHNQEVAVYVAGEGDGYFDTDDYLFFYGEAISGKYLKYADDNVYWLTYGKAVHRPMLEVGGTPAGAPGPTSFEDIVHFEVDAAYWSNMPGADDDFSRWYWDYATAPGWMDDKPAPLTDVVPVTVSDPLTATIQVALYGYTDMPPDPDQHIVVWVNDNWVGEFEWDGGTAYFGQSEFDQAFLNPGTGNNTVRFEAVLNPGVDYSYPTLDWFEIGYQRAYQADGDVLAYGNDLDGDVTVDGFTTVPPSGTEDLTTFDVTDPLTVTRVLSTVWEASAIGYRVRFGDTASGAQRYWTGLPAARLSPVSIEPDSPSDLRSAANGADYIMISYGDFAGNVEPLRAHYDAPGLRTVLVDVQDVYDEFSGGVFYPGAIQDFLAYAYANWAPPAPSYVLLVGDGHYDFKYLDAGTNQGQYMPPYLSFVDPVIGETAADNRYVTLVGDDSWPDMHLGRFPANTLAEAQVMVNKSIDYQTAPAPGIWTSNLLFVADNPDAGGDFYMLSDEIVDLYAPATYTTTKVYYGTGAHTTAAVTRDAIKAAISEGQLLVSYIGHSAIPWWADEKLFGTGDIAGLTNGAKLPVMLPMTCQEGYFANPSSSTVALSEVIVRTAGKGAVASWAATGWGVAAGHDYLQKGFYHAVFTQGVRRLGAATTAGKLNLWNHPGGAYRDLMDTYGLLGDPMLHIDVHDADLQMRKTVEPAGAISPGDVLTYTLTFTNAGPETAHSVVLSDVLPSVLVNDQVLYESPEVTGQVPGQRYVWEIEDLAPGTGGEIRLRATVDPAAEAGTVVNEAELVAAEPEAVPSDNSASVSNEIVVVTNWHIYLPIVLKQ